METERSTQISLDWQRCSQDSLLMGHLHFTITHSGSSSITCYFDIRLWVISHPLCEKKQIRILVLAVLLKSKLACEFMSWLDSICVCIILFSLHIYHTKYSWYLISPPESIHHNFETAIIVQYCIGKGTIYCCCFSETMNLQKWKNFPSHISCICRYLLCCIHITVQ